MENSEYLCSDSITRIVSNITVTQVSILLPTFERASYLRRAIDSALAQTFTDFKLLIGDNSRTAETEAVVRSYDDPRIEYRRHARNLGSQGNWLELCRLADTPLLATLHDDNVLCPRFLESLAPPMLADPSIAMAFADFQVIDCQDQVLETESAALSERTRRDSLDQGRFCPDTAQGLRLVAVWNSPNPSICGIVTRDAVLQSEFPSSFEPLYDIWLSYQIVRRSGALYYARDKLAKYRVHPRSTTSAGYGEPEDRLFAKILEDNAHAGPVIDEIRQYWSLIRWGRAKRLMDDTTHREISRRNFSAAAPSLSPARRVLASIAGSSDMGWSLLRPLLRED